MANIEVCCASGTATGAVVFCIRQTVIGAHSQSVAARAFGAAGGIMPAVVARRPNIHHVGVAGSAADVRAPALNGRTCRGKRKQRQRSFIHRAAVPRIPPIITSRTPPTVVDDLNFAADGVVKKFPRVAGKRGFVVAELQGHYRCRRSDSMKIALKAASVIVISTSSLLTHLGRPKVKPSVLPPIPAAATRATKVPWPLNR